MKTIKSVYQFTGVGIHTGQESTVTISPSKESGIVLNGFVMNPRTLIYGEMSTQTITGIRTVEHLLGYLNLKGIDSVTIEVNGKEIPILDGGAKEFNEVIETESFIPNVDLIPYSISERRRYVHPYCNMIDYMELNSPPEENITIRSSRMEINEILNDLDSLFNARTFVWESTLERLKMIPRIGLGAVANNNFSIITKENYQEHRADIIRHKLLDFFGDLTGVLHCIPKDCSLRLINPGHEKNLRFAGQLFSSSKPRSDQ